jgi:prepilin peptidase CpaA
MHGQGFQVLAAAIAAWIAVIAAVWDLKWRRIPNILTIPAVISGVAMHSVQSGRNGLVSSLLGMAIGGGILLVFYILGGMGAGDVKLMAGVGALAGYPLVLAVLFLMGIAGGTMAVGKLVARVIKRDSVGNGGLTDSPGSATLAQEHEMDRPGGGVMKETMPYGVAIAAGTVVSLVLLLLADGSL